MAWQAGNGDDRVLDGWMDGCMHGWTDRSTDDGSQTRNAPGFELPVAAAAAGAAAATLRQRRINKLVYGTRIIVKLTFRALPFSPARQTGRDDL